MIARELEKKLVKYCCLLLKTGRILVPLKLRNVKVETPGLLGLGPSIVPISRTIYFYPIC